MKRKVGFTLSHISLVDQSAVSLLLSISPSPILFPHLTLTSHPITITPFPSVDVSVTRTILENNRLFIYSISFNVIQPENNSQPYRRRLTAPALPITIFKLQAVVRRAPSTAICPLPPWSDSGILPWTSGSFTCAICIWVK
jgi:hypothetical protein